MIPSLIVDAAACFRLTRLVVDDKLTEPIREKIWEQQPPEEGGVGFAISCVYCTSIWAAAGVVLARKLAPRLWPPVAEMLAISAVAGEAAARAS